jgi:hypothetical protein
MVRLRRTNPVSNRKPRQPHDIESTIYTVLLIVAAVLLMAYVLSVPGHSSGLLLPTSTPVATAEA